MRCLFHSIISRCCARREESDADGILRNVPLRCWNVILMQIRLSSLWSLWNGVVQGSFIDVVELNEVEENSFRSFPGSRNISQNQIPTKLTNSPSPLASFHRPHRLSVVLALFVFIYSNDTEIAPEKCLAIGKYPKQKISFKYLSKSKGKVKVRDGAFYSWKVEELRAHQSENNFVINWIPSTKNKSRELRLKMESKQTASTWIWMESKSRANHSPPLTRSTGSQNRWKWLFCTNNEAPALLCVSFPWIHFDFAFSTSGEELKNILREKAEKLFAASWIVFPSWVLADSFRSLARCFSFDFLFWFPSSETRAW